MATYTYGSIISATPLLLFLLAFLLSYPAASAFNITKILEQSPDFGTFNSYLTQTQLAATINSRETITVLAVDNSAMSAVSGQPLDVVKKVLSVHVVLDYYDDEKLKNLNKKSTILTTLFQSTGMANDQMGFLNVTKTASGVQMGSAVPGAGLTVELVKTVAKQPYNISVLQVSGVIMPPGIQNANQSANATAATPPPAHAPAAAPKAAPSPKKAPAPGASASAPAPAASSPEADSPAAASPPSPSAPSEAPAADAPAPSKDASAPAGDASSPSGDNAPSDAPTANAGAPDPAADAPAAEGEGEAPGPSEASSGTRVVLGAGVAAVMGAAVLAAF